MFRVMLTAAGGFGLATAAVLAAHAGADRFVTPAAAMPAGPVARVEPAQSPAVNPAVEPGAVKWHPSAQAAREAAKVSGKPVLMFHLMGRLDRQFC